MENSGKIVELLAESLQRLDQMVGEQKETNRRLDHLESQSEKHEKRFEGFEKRFESMEGNLFRIEKNLVTLNVQTAENTRAIFKLGEKVDNIAELHNRLVKLEKAVFK